MTVADARVTTDALHAAVTWIVGDATSVLDLGAGTGALTDVLVRLDLDVTAVDPIEEMVEELEIRVPGAPRILGTAEDLPVADRSVDAVIVGRAWQWFQPARAVPEIARVLRPGGALGLVWSRRDLRSAWMREVAALLGADPDVGDGGDVVRIGAPFGPVEERRFDSMRRLTRAAFLDLVRVRPDIRARPAADRHERLVALETLLLTHPDIAGAVELAVPYVTHAYRATL